MAAQRFGKVRFVEARSIWEIDARPHGRFRSIPVQGARPVPLASREIADGVLAQIRAEIQSGKSEWAAVAPYLPKAASTVDKIVEKWKREAHVRVGSGDLAPRTLKRIESYSKPEGHFSWLYPYSIYEITPGHLSDWNLWLMERLEHQNTRKHVVDDMRTIFRWLHARGELGAVPTFPTVKRRKHVPNVVAPSDQEDILEAIPEDRRGIYIMAVEEVFRPGELRALNLSDYSFATKKVTVRAAMDGDTNSSQRKETKEDDVRVRIVSDRMAAWLEAHTSAEDRLTGDRPLFINPDARTAPGGRYNSQELRNGWSKAADAVGLGHAKMYEGTKHSTLTAARNSGASLDQLQKAAGHKDPRSTEIYAEMGEEQATRVLRIARKPR